MTHMVNVVMTAEKELKADVVEGTVKIGFCDSRYCTMEDKIIDFLSRIIFQQAVMRSLINNYH